jgi:hypothetical protein
VRILLRVLVALLGLAVAAAGFVLAVEVGWAWWRPGHSALLVPWRGWLASARQWDWTSGQVRLIAGIVAVAGLVLLLLAIGARRPRRVPLDEQSADLTVVTTPRSLARLVGRAVRAEDGVSAATVTASARKVRIKADSRLNTRAELKPRVLDTARETVENLPLPRTPKVTVVVGSDRTSAVKRGSSTPGPVPVTSGSAGSHDTGSEDPDGTGSGSAGSGEGGRR